MRIITWNVNGLRAALNKGIGEWLRSQSADVVCLQEVKTKAEQLSPEHMKSFLGYSVLWNSAERPGYSGVVSLLSVLPQEFQVGLGDPRFDPEGRAIRMRYPDFVLYNLYFPSGQRDYGRVTYKLDFYSHLLEICDTHHAAGEAVILCGDFNTAHRPIDLRYPKQNVITSGFLPEERAWIDRYLEHGFVDVYRLLYPERVQYTWWTYRLNARQRGIGWRLDYFLVSERLVSRIQDVIIHDDIPGSDHCPVTLIIQ